MFLIFSYNFIARCGLNNTVNRCGFWKYFLKNATSAPSLSKKSRSKTQDPRSKIQNPRSKIQDPRAKIQDPKSKIQNPKSKIQDPKSKIRDPRSKIQAPESRIKVPVDIGSWNTEPHLLFRPRVVPP